MNMVHEKKFRLWDRIKSAWVPGAYGFSIIGELVMSGELIKILNSYGVKNLNNIRCDEWSGAKDIHGVEVYENDKIELKRSNGKWLRGQVYFDHIFLRWSVILDDGQTVDLNRDTECVVL